MPSAIRALHKDANIAAGASVLFLSAAVIFFAFRSPASILLVLAGVTHGFLWLYRQRRLRMMKQVLRGQLGEFDGPQPQVQPQRYVNLLTQRLPRRLRLKRQFRALAMFWIPIVTTFFYISFRLIAHPMHYSDPNAGVAILVLASLAAGAAIVGWIRGWRNAHLLREGDLVLGRVTEVLSAEEGNLIRRVTYEYKVTTGRIYEGDAIDWGEEFYEGMFIPIFYDRENPFEHKAICGSMYDVRPG